MFLSLVQESITPTLWSYTAPLIEDNQGTSNWQTNAVPTGQTIDVNDYIVRDAVEEGLTPILYVRSEVFDMKTFELHAIVLMNEKWVEF